MVVIPYCAEGAQGRELEYAVAGWRRHFKEDFFLVLVGDYAPVDVDVFIPCKRIEHKDDGNYIPHLDHVHKFLRVMELFPEQKGFIYTCDDMYAVNDFTLEDVKRLKYLDDDMGGNMLSPNAWDRDVAKTRNLCVQEGLPVRNFVCHLPVYYEKQKLMAIYKAFDCEHNSCVVEDVYFNAYFGDAEAIKPDGVRMGVTTTDIPEDEFLRRMEYVIWITNSPTGWSETLDKVLNDYYNG